VRPYTIGTTLPNRTLDDESATIETSGLRNSVIVQRWSKPGVSQILIGMGLLSGLEVAVSL
jgi:hypothetical protein